MEFDLQQSTALLARMPAVFDSLLRGLPDGWTRSNEGPGTWSSFDVIAHLIQCEGENWIPRARMIVDYGEGHAFEPFGRGGHERVSHGKSLEDLLDEFARVRVKSLDDLDAMNLQPEDLERRGRHPAFGPVTLAQLLATWAAHDLTHLHQVSRVMGCQYREAVGPWTRFLGVMQCGGHSDPA